jgi:hypothetical protein
VSGVGVGVELRWLDLGRVVDEMCVMCEINDAYWSDIGSELYTSCCGVVITDSFLRISVSLLVLSLGGGSFWEDLELVGAVFNNFRC